MQMPSVLEEMVGFPVMGILPGHGINTISFQPEIPVILMGFRVLEIDEALESGRNELVKNDLKTFCGDLHGLE